MAAKKSERSETLDDLLLRHLGAGERYDEFAVRAGINPKTLFRLRRGMNALPHRSTIKSLADALGLDVEIVRKALVASHAAAEKRDK